MEDGVSQEEDLKPVWTLTKTLTFEAAHKLPEHHGKCRRLHGHSYAVTLVIVGRKLWSEGSEKGMVMDYNTVGNLAKQLIDEHLDHRYLNEIEGLEYPTAEILAQWIYWKLREKVGSDLRAVRIAETCTSEVEFRLE